MATDAQSQKPLGIVAPELYQAALPVVEYVWGSDPWFAFRYVVDQDSLSSAFWQMPCGRRARVRAGARAGGGGGRRATHRADGRVLARGTGDGPGRDHDDAQHGALTYLGARGGAGCPRGAALWHCPRSCPKQF